MTTATARQDSSGFVQQYLQHIVALREELQTAMGAIARNSLPDFEHSLWQQEMISTGMQRSLLLLRGVQLSTAELTQLRIAVTALQQVSHSYQGLIGQAGQTASLLRGLCTLYGQSPQQAAGKQHALLCEA